MTYETYGNFTNRTGNTDLSSVFTYSADVVPSFIPMSLFAFFIMIAMGNYIIRRNLVGTGDFPASFAVAGYLTAILAVLLSLIPNLINTSTLVVTIVIAVLGTIWLYFSRNRT